MWNFICLFQLYFLIVQSSLDVAPRNKAIVAGERMEMECRTNNGTKVREWTLQRPLTSEKLKIFMNFENDPKRINPDFSYFGAAVDASGSGLIYKNSTRLEDAGIYTCRIQEGQKQLVSYSAQLIVLEKEPVCESNLNSDINLLGKDKIWFQCSVNFSGKWIPTVEWRQHCGDMTEGEYVLTDGIETIVATNSSLTSTLILAIDSNRSSCNISCQTYFTTTNSNTINTAAINIPDYNHLHVWNSHENQVSTWEPISRSAISISRLQRGDTTVVTLSRDEPEDINTGLISMVLASLLSLVAGVATTVVVIYCIRLRNRKSETNAASTYEEVDADTRAALDGYEMIPYASSDGYNEIGEPNIEEATECKPALPKCRHNPNATYPGLNDDVTDTDLDDEVSSSYLKINEGEEEIPSAHLTTK